MSEPTGERDRYVNVEHPAQIPTWTGGKPYPVIARFVLPDLSEEWRPATSVRWNATHVLVGVDLDDDRAYLWLRVDDVKRVIRRPAPAVNPDEGAAQPASSDTV